jgi:hypothetical protein
MNGKHLLSCDRAEPGLCLDDPSLVDFSHQETTPDQRRIEEFIESFGPTTSDRILHVGVGNSGLARRFGLRVGLIDGVTVSEAERAAAEALLLDNYTVRVVNKYAPGLRRGLGHEYTYDFIVDNNLTSFACCLEHVKAMFEGYRACLDAAGWILTDQGGLDWTANDNDEWRLSPEELTAIAQSFGFTTHRLRGNVFGLTGSEDATNRLARRGTAL